ncbi:hypothetical protein ACFE33_15895 (plasmid) [Falsihalocynthiibacter sp. SS001]|uniref:hypothetical protein n=1 Tax=Falsihalocynthiibacter sp. SS001 TaxID=3349698 RepID=UPI0036D2E6E7
MSKRPDVPKRLAARLRGAYAKVTDARSSLRHYRKRIGQAENRIAEYEADPQGFADRYYHGMAWNSYPPQTNISREREGLEYRRMRILECYGEQREALVNMRRVESDVLNEVKNMRLSAGRVPWPRGPLTKTELRAIEIEEEREWRKEDRRQREEDRQHEREQARIDEEEQRHEEEEWQREIAAMSPEQRQQVRQEAKRLFESGAIKFGIETREE